jgi:hypothetical protein
MDKIVQVEQNCQYGQYGQFGQFDQNNEVTHGGPIVMFRSKEGAVYLFDRHMLQEFQDSLLWLLVKHRCNSFFREKKTDVNIIDTELLDKELDQASKFFNNNYRWEIDLHVRNGKIPLPENEIIKIADFLGLPSDEDHLVYIDGEYDENEDEEIFRWDSDDEESEESDGTGYHNGPCKYVPSMKGVCILCYAIYSKDVGFDDFDDFDDIDVNDSHL